METQSNQEIKGELETAKDALEKMTILDSSVPNAGVDGMISKICVVNHRQLSAKPPRTIHHSS